MNVTSPAIDHPLAADAALRRRLIGLAGHWLGDASAAEDLLHDAYLRTANSTLPDSAASRDAWLVTVLHNLCIDQLRRQGRYQAILGQLADQGMEQRFDRDEPAHLAAQAQRVDEALLELVHNLPADDVAAVLLLEVFDFSHAELGALSGRTEVASRQRLHRVMGRLNGSTQAGVPQDEDLAALFALCQQALARYQTAALVTLVRTGAPQTVAPRTQLVHAGNQLALLIRTGKGASAWIPLGEAMSEAA